jgi:pimeloyl-ACP methyl ester carboxylesterase
VVALHGFPQHWWMWRRVIPLLAGEARILAMDLRGLGWSDQPADGDFRKARIAEDAVALLDALGIAQAVFLGHDWGAWAGFHAVLDAPGRWTAFVPTGIAHPWQPPSVVLGALPRLAYQPPLGVPVLGPRVVRAGVRRILRGAWGDRATYDAAAEDLYAERYADAQRAEAGSRYYRDFLLREALRTGSFAGRRLQVPTRLLYGRRDFLGVAPALGIERHGEDASTVLLDGCGHFVPEERPAEVAEAIRGLL